MPVADRPLLSHALQGVAHSGVCDEIIVVISPDHTHHATNAINEAQTANQTLTVPVRVVHGGATRQESVANGLKTCHDKTTHVLVHDAARAFTPTEVFERIQATLASGAQAVVPVTAVTDSLRHVDGAAVDRSSYRAVQTPQGFCKQTLADAHERAAGINTATDDASLVESTGIHVTQVEGHSHSLKITHPLDLLIANHLAEQQNPLAR